MLLADNIDKMNSPNRYMHNSNLKIATTDLVLISLFAALGLATKNFLHPLLGPLVEALYVPTGAVTGGLYMMWPIIAFWFIKKPGAATLVSFTQALISLVLPYGNFGLLSFIIYLGPGLTIDAFYFLSKHKACCLGCCMIASSLANVVGTILVGTLVLFLPQIVLLFLVVVAGISGCIGGFIANILLNRIGKLGIKGKNIE